MALKLNWKNTQLQQQPATQRAFAALSGNQRIVPVHILPMADGAGVAPIDVVDKFTTLTTPVGVVDVDYSFGAPAYGLYDGVDHESRLALEISSASGGVVATDPSFLDPGHKSFGIYLQYRIVEGDSGVTVSIMRKGGDYATPAVDDVTWQLHYDETTHRVYMALAYNSAGAGSFTASAYVGGTVDDAAYHWLYAKVNMVAQTVEVFGDTDAGTSTDISTMIDAIEAQGERFENVTDLVEIGSNSDLNANDNPMQICYMAILRGSASDLFTRAVGQTMWVHGKCQNILDTGYEITYARTSRVGYPIAADKVAMWAGSAGGGDVQVPLEFNENWGGDDFLTLGCHPATENLLGDANDLTAWTTVTATVNEAELVSERGHREMDVVDATSNGGYVYKDITGLTALTTYRVSYYAATDTGAHTARAEATQADLSTTLASLESALTTTRGRKTFTFTTLAAETQTRIKLFGGTAATQTNTGFHCVMVTEGTAYGPCIYNDINQDGTTETLAAQTQVLNVTGNELTNPDEGSVWVAYIQSVQNTGDTRVLFDIASAASNVDRRYMYIAADGTQLAATYDGAGASYQLTTAHAALTADAEYNRSMRWRRKANLAAGAYTLEDDITAPGALTQTVVGTANTEGSGGHTRIYIACRQTGSGQLSGLQSLHLYPSEVRSFNIAPAEQTQTTVAPSAFTSDPGGSGGGGGTTDHQALSNTHAPADDHTQYLTNTGARLIAGQSLAHTTADNNTVLTVSKIPAGAQSGSVLQLTSGVNLTGPALSITNGGSGDAISVSPDTDQTVIFGRARLDSRTTDNVVLSHYDLTTTLNYSVRITNSGQLNLNTPTGQIMYFRVQGTEVMSMFTGYLRMQLGNGPQLTNANATNAVPTLISNQTSLNTGIGGVTGTLSLITGGTEALLLDASQDAYFASDIYLGLNQSIWFDDDYNSRMYASADNDIRLTPDASSGAWYRWTTGGYSTYEGSNQIFRTVGSGVSSSSHVGMALKNNAVATAGVPEQNSPALRWDASAWDTNTLAAVGSQFWMQLRAYDGDPVTGKLAFRINYRAVNSELGHLDMDGSLVLNPDTDTTNILGRTRIDSRTANFAHFSHYDRAGTTEYGVRHSDAGQLVLNATALVDGILAVDNNVRYYWDDTFFSGAGANAGAVKYGNATDTVPSLLPNKVSTNTGMGGVVGTISLITGGTEAVLINASQQVTLTDGTGVSPALNFQANSGNGLSSTASALLVLVGGATQITVGTTSTIFDTTIKIGETAAGTAFQAGKGQLWVDNAVNQTFYFQDDLGVDFPIAGALAPSAGGVTTLSVVSLADPSTELNAISGSAKGDLRLCYQTDAASDEWTLYAWDDADSDAEDIPYRVDGLTGAWAAIAGKYLGSALKVDARTITNAYALTLDNCGAGTSGIKINNGSTNAQLWGTTGTRWNNYFPNRTVKWVVANDAYDAATQAFEFSQASSTPTRHTMLIPAAADLTTGNLLRLQDDYAAELEHVALNLVNETVATTGVQKFSPMHVMEGRGFYTAGSSQAVKIATQLQPVEQATNPIANIVWKGSIENVAVGAYSDIMKLSWNGTIGQLLTLDGTAAAPGQSYMSEPGLGWYRAAASDLRLAWGGAYRYRFSGLGISVNLATSETLPRLYLASSPNTGIGFPAADEVSLITNSTEALLLDVSQNATFAGNITAVPDTNGTFIFGRTRIDSRTSDYACFSHYDQSGTTQYAIRQNFAGTTTVNAGATLSFAIAGTTKFNLTTSGIFAAITNGPGMVNEAPTSNNPTLLISRGSFTTGIGGSSGSYVSTIVGSAEVMRFLSTQDAFLYGHFYPNSTNTKTCGKAGNRWSTVYTYDVSALGNITASGDIDAAGGFRRALDAVWVDSPAANTEYQMRRDGALSPLSSDIHGWHVAARAGSAVELVAYVDVDVTAAQVNFWVMKSTDGGDNFSDWWGTAAAPVVSLKFGGSTEVTFQADAKGTNTFNAGDIFMIMIKPLTGWTGGRYFYAQMTIEC